MTVAVTGAQPGYTSVTRVSDAERVARGTQSASPSPRVKGKTKVGRTLKARPGPHDADSRLVYRWYVGGHFVRGNDARTLKIKPRYRGKRVWVRVNAWKPGYRKATGVSAKRGPIR